MVPPRVPASLSAAPELMLARAAETIDESGHMPGGTAWSWKWDGYRLAAVVDDQAVTLWSRNGKDLTASFPDLRDAIADQVPAGTVLDGEAVVWGSDERLDFSALQRRLATKRAERLARVQPANYVAFDVLAVAGRDVRDRPWARRHELLEGLAGEWRPPLTLSPTTQDAQVAEGWFDELSVVGIEGLVAYGLDQRYHGGRRDWLKIKHRSEVDVICGAVIGPIERPRIVVAGLPLDGELRIVGRTTLLDPVASKGLGRLMAAPSGEHPWPTVVTSATLNGLGADREPVTLTLVDPLVVEVSADVAWSGRSFRHPLRFRRVRPDLDPAEVVLPDRLT